jgi:hypothetical protein
MIVIRMANLPALQLGFYLQLQIFSSKKALLQLRPGNYQRFQPFGIDFKVMYLVIYVVMPKV